MFQGVGLQLEDLRDGLAAAGIDVKSLIEDVGSSADRQKGIAQGISAVATQACLPTHAHTHTHTHAPVHVLTHVHVCLCMHSCTLGMGLKRQLRVGFYPQIDDGLAAYRERTDLLENVAELQMQVEQLKASNRNGMQQVGLGSTSRGMR